ncbi:RagB/SusD family nutrient uptake outer membrane protein [Pedobacter deserti]|uniref:RagB/SusD family nutrient uptake outer membrane protein n=1 Tax=Pedobacter deserti TaxID=2817382 RepID=UPI002109876C|nr:RagB/SusD family nutrient uptake outer membrane protein [Pedobacter sp. SYSU D00382]
MKHKILMAIVGLTLLSQYGCKKELDALPENALVEGNAIVNQQTAATALNGVYYRFANATVTNTNWLSNQINGGILTGYLDDGNNTLNEAKNLLGTSPMNSEWRTQYTLINATNGVIEGLNKLGSAAIADDIKLRMLAEARFLRAYSHFKLLLWFGQWWDLNSAYGVMLREKFITSTNISQARASVKDSYAFILEDLNFSIAANVPATTNVYANKWTAMALKMRVLMSRGQGSDYADCAQLGNTIITTGPYVLENNPRDIFYTKGLTSTEVIMGVKPQANQENYYYNTSGNYVSRNSYYVATAALNTLLTNDPRKSWMIGNAGRRGKGYYFIKYVQPALATTMVSEVAYAFRLSEIYLMQSEAIARSGGDLNLAKTQLKAVMTRAGVTNFSAVDGSATANELCKEIYYEYVRSLIGEDGQAYWALLRFPLAKVTELRPTITSVNQYILPIPKTEFVSNPAIGDQNPGYSK